MFVAVSSSSLDDINLFSDERPATIHSSLIFCASNMFESERSFEEVPSDGGVRSDNGDNVEGGVVYVSPSQVVLVTSSIGGGRDDDDASNDDPRNVGVLQLRLDTSTSRSDAGVIAFCFFLFETSKLGGPFRILLLLLLSGSSLRLG